MHKLFYTVLEASELCNVSQPTIRKAVKTRNMKAYTDDRKKLHIYGPDIWDYYREIVTKRINNALDEVYSRVRKLNIAKEEYLKAFANLDGCEDDDRSIMTDIYTKKQAEVCTANQDYIRSVDNLRELEYEATLIYEVNL